MISIDLIGTLTIQSGQTVSQSLTSDIGFSQSKDLIIYVPLVLTGACTLRVSWMDSAVPGTAADWRNLYVNGADFTLPAGKAVWVPAASWQAMSIISTLAEGAQRDFPVMAQLGT